MVLTGFFMLLIAGYAVGVGSGVLRIRRQADERISATARPRGRSVWALRLGGYLMVAGAGGLYAWRGDHTLGWAWIAIVPYLLFCEVPVWLHNRCLPVESETR